MAITITYVGQTTARVHLTAQAVNLWLRFAVFLDMTSRQACSSAGSSVVRTKYSTDLRNNELNSGKVAPQGSYCEQAPKVTLCSEGTANGESPSRSGYAEQNLSVKPSLRQRTRVRWLEVDPLGW